MHEKLFVVGQPNIHVIETDVSELYGMRTELVRHFPQAVIKILRGHKATTAGRFFDECYAIFQFPPYCGENWDGFAECAADLRTWTPHPHVLLVSHAAQLLQDADPEEFKQLFFLLEKIHEAWATADESYNLPATSFHVVLQEHRASMNILQERLAAAEVSYDEL